MIPECMYIGRPVLLHTYEGVLTEEGLWVTTFFYYEYHSKRPRDGASLNTYNVLFGGNRCSKD